MSTRIETIIRLIGRKSGASIQQLQDATGWKPQSIRSAITGLWKKGYDIHRHKNTKDVTVYAIPSRDAAS